MTLEAIIGQITNLVVAVTALIIAVRAHTTINGEIKPQVKSLEQTVNGNGNAVSSQTTPVA